MTETQIRYFLALASHKNMTKAAKQFKVSQPAFSKQISALEKDLGFTLFDRFKRGMELTGQGRIFYELFSNIERQLQSSIDKAAKLTKAAVEPVIIGYMEGWRADGFIWDILSRFKAAHPQLPVIIHQFSDRQLINGFNGGSLDIVFIHPEAMDESDSFSFKTVYKARMAIMLSRTLSDSKDFSPEQLAKEPLIVISNKNNHEFIGYTNLVYYTLGFKPREIIVADTEESQLFMVDGGCGFALISSLSHTYGQPSYNFIDTNYYREVIMLYKTNPVSYSCSLLMSEIEAELNL